MKLDEYETDILNSVENGEWESIGDITQRREELQNIVKNQKKQSISIRINERDIYELKKKALENGIPYQNIIQLLIHQFVSNKIKLTL